MDSQKTTKLFKAIELTNDDTVTPKELAEISKTIIDVLNEVKKDNDLSLNAISKFSLDLEETVRKEGKITKKAHKELVDGLQKLKKEIVDLVASTKKEIIANIPDSADLSSIENEIEILKEETVKKGEVEVETADSIRNKLEVLQGDERLDKSAIRGLDTVIDQEGLDFALGVLDKRTQYLINKTPSSSGSSITLQTNGTNNGSQSILNLKQGTNVTLADDGVGGVTINATGGGTPGGSTTQLQCNNAGAFGGISGATTDGTNITLGAGNLLVSDVKASGSGGVSIKNSSGGTVADFGTGGSTNSSIHGAINIGVDSADYIQFVGGTGSTTENMVGSSTDIDKVIVPKGAGKFKVTGNVNISGLTASQLLATDASKNLVSLDTATYPSLTELTYVKGVTSAIQTQLNAKQATLVSGTNIKTVNGTTLLGSGDIVAGLSWGSSISGTTDGGLSLTSSNSTDASASAFKLTAGNTQANVSVLANIQLGTSGNVMGLLIKGKGADTGGDIGTGKNHMTLWSNVAIGTARDYKLISAGYGTTFTESTFLRGDGTMKFATGASLSNSVLEIDMSSAIRSGLVINGVFPSTNADYQILDIFPTTNGTVTSRTTHLNRIGASRNNSRTTGTTTEDLDTLQVVRQNSQSGAGGTYTIAGSALKVSNYAIASAGSLTDASHVVELVQESTSTGDIINAGTSVAGGATTVKFTVNPSGNIYTAGTLELGHASDTTISRVSAGVIAVEGATIPTISSTSTLTNKRIEPRVISAASYTTDTGSSLDVSTADLFVITAQAGALLFNAPSGTPVQGQKLMIRIKDNGTARALTWNAVFRAMGTALPSTTVLSKTLYLGFIYNSTDTKWDLVASAQEV